MEHTIKIAVFSHWDIQINYSSLHRAQILSLDEQKWIFAKCKRKHNTNKKRCKSEHYANSERNLDLDSKIQIHTRKNIHLRTVSSYSIAMKYSYFLNSVSHDGFKICNKLLLDLL